MSFLLTRTFPGICFFLALGIASAGEIPIDITATTPRIYKSEETAASAEPHADGVGMRLSYDFENGGNTVRFDFLLSPPLDGPLSKFTITAKGSEGPLNFLIRDANSQGIGYVVGPLTADEQTFTVDLANPSQRSQRQATIEYPIKGISFTIKKPADPKGSIEILKVTAENAE